MSSQEQDAPRPDAESLARSVAEAAGLHRHEDGRVNLLKTAGGWQGIAESILPGLVFLVAYTATQSLPLALVLSLAPSVVFAIVRLVQRQRLTMALAGVVGVGISAWLAQSTGNASNYYVPGFFTNGAYLLALVISILVKWPLAGLLFGFLRNEGVHWRQDTVRYRRYAVATWVIIGIFALRLAVQLPLYFLGDAGLPALGTTRLIMGTPLYVLGLWLAWLLSRPAPAGESADGSGE
ncbi:MULTISPECIES: DUF3159 domain-containing protein [Arthrobacter]|uniref:DUF3159 domain-containing protein n=2 Tax=Arthrobacter TaxID=1663 RepID=A0ABU9KH29_9MICC|nr:DUF3159 domain-containing protein [Arthrobacter sp. YJM1]MDP5225856.1 DUF3159 domain-containing protein [Arthrobacter sp. YJM1]